MQRFAILELALLATCSVEPRLVEPRLVEPTPVEPTPVEPTPVEVGSSNPPLSILTDHDLRVSCERECERSSFDREGLLRRIIHASITSKADPALVESHGLGPRSPEHQAAEQEAWQRFRAGEPFVALHRRTGLEFSLDDYDFAGRWGMALHVDEHDRIRVCVMFDPSAWPDPVRVECPEQPD